MRSCFAADVIGSGAKTDLDRTVGQVFLSLASLADWRTWLIVWYSRAR